MDRLYDMLLSIFTIAAGVAILALLVSKKSNTSAVIQSWFSGNSNLLGVATAPVTGTKTNLDLSYPSSSPFGDIGGNLSVGFGNI